MTKIHPLDGPMLAPQDGSEPKRLVILLHGVGADGNDLIGLAPFYRLVMPDALFIAPNAPFRFDMAPFGFQWFSIQNIQADTRLNGVRAAAPSVDAFIDDRLARHRLADAQLVLIGFSQGAMMALHVGLRRPRPAAAIIAHSGILVGEHLLAGEIRSRPPVLLTHGARDDVIPVDFLPAAETALKAAGVAVEAQVMAGLGHGIDEETIRADMRFLTRLGDPQPR